MVSIATGNAQPLRKSPAIATVITAEDIASIGATELNEVLETVPGLHMGASGIGYKPIFSIRGIHTQTSPQVLILVNGMSIKNVFDASLGAAWGRMPVTGIARIEVIRGPGSALYGADAFSGVINIITKSASEVRGLEVGARLGSFDRHDQFAQWGGELGGFDAYFYVERHHSDGSDRTVSADAQTALDALFPINVSLAPGPVNLTRDNIEARADIARGHWRLRGGFQEINDSGVGAGVSQALDPVGHGDGRRLSADLSYENPAFSRNWSLSGTLGYYQVENLSRLRLFPPGAFGGTFPDGVIGNPDVYERHYRGEVSALYSGLDRHRLRVGAGYRKEDLYRVEESRNYTLVDLGVPLGVIPIPLGNLVDVTDVAAFVREEDRTIAYAFLQDEWNFQRDWTLTAGLRLDDYSDFGTTLNPRLALVWQTSYALTTKLLYGRAFRAPSFQELFAVNNPANIGNSSLDPETIDTVELGLDWDAGRGLRAAFNVFYYQMDDIIRFAPDPAPATSATAQNTGKQTGYGLEAELAWQATQRLRLSGNYAYQHSTDDAADDDVGFAPSHLAYLRTDWAMAPQWTLSGQATGVFDRKRAPGDLRQKIDDYVTVDLTVRGQELFNDGWGVRISARNLFNSDVREPSGSALIPNDLPMAGRNVFFEISKAFD
ncbi:MAG TPA: TonB-dependent receptor [Gammaproteobacteria bacterium]|nr:TonB-dependent receptor [Gammaproteobacteria bacterium]